MLVSLVEEEMGKSEQSFNADSLIDLIKVKI